MPMLLNHKNQLIGIIKIINKLDMTLEEKEILINDIIARLPYGIKCYIPEINDYRVLGTVQYNGENTLFDFWDKNHKRYEHQLYIEEIKPYLFPMSSMTEEQYNDFFAYFHNVEMNEIKTSGDYLKAAYLGENAKRDWLNKNHFDYNYHIEKGLALDATNLNIY